MMIQGAEQLAVALAAVDPDSCDAYGRQAHLLIAYVNGQAAARPAHLAQIRPYDAAVLAASHAAHARVMEAQLRLASAATMLELLLWVYRTHLLRGIAPEAIAADFALWQAALAQHLDEPARHQILAVYGRLLALHDQLVLSAQTPPQSPSVAPVILPYYQRFLAALLRPDAGAAIAVTHEFVTRPDRIGPWLEGVIQPSLYEIGALWARGAITVGQEHLATAIAQQVMAVCYPMILELPRDKGRIIVAASPGEFHQVGTRIVADLLEVNGWDVYCTGANTPAQSVVALLKETGARFLCISTTLSASLPAVADLIGQVRAAPLASLPKILVGGQAYGSDPSLWRKMGADAYGRTAREGLAYLEAHQP